jgi:hypothetical protein
MQQLKAYQRPGFAAFQRAGAQRTILRAAAQRGARAPLAQAQAQAQQHLLSQQQPRPATKQQHPRQQLRPLSLAAGPLLTLAAAAGAAWADGEPTYDYPAQDDPVVTVLFTAAIGLLSVVTLGVRRPAGEARFWLTPLGAASLAPRASAAPPACAPLALSLPQDPPRRAPPPFPATAGPLLPLCTAAGGLSRGAVVPGQPAGEAGPGGQPLQQGDRVRAAGGSRRQVRGPGRRRSGGSLDAPAPASATQCDPCLCIAVQQPAAFPDALALAPAPTPPRR